MSSYPNNPINTKSDDESFEDFVDDTDDRMFFKILLQQKLLLQVVESSSSRPKRRRYVERDREGAHAHLVKDYFYANPTFGSDVFRRHFQMSRELFNRIVDTLQSHDQYFHWRVDATGRKGFLSLQKCTIAIRQLVYGGPADHYDEYLRVAETTCINCLFNFCRCVINLFGERYLRKATAADCQRLLHMLEQRHGFPRILGSLDCMHCEWKNCPVAWKGQFTRGDHGIPTIMLEVVASTYLWIWHVFLRVACSNNDINVLNQPPLFNDVLQGKAPEEAARKDVERAFGALQARWAIIKGPAQFWYKSNLKGIMYSCIILHNMIVEDEEDTTSDWSEEPNINDNTTSQNFQGSIGGFNEYIKRDSELRDREIHHQLRADLIEHLWARCNNNLLYF